MAERKGKTLWVQSMYGVKNRKPIVVLTMPGGEMLQMTPAEARDVAMNILRGAEAAEGDAFVFEFFFNLMGSDLHAATVMDHFRQWRDKNSG